MNPLENRKCLIKFLQLVLTTLLLLMSACRIQPAGFNALNPTQQNQTVTTISQDVVTKTPLAETPTFFPQLVITKTQSGGDALLLEEQSTPTLRHDEPKHSDLSFPQCQPTPGQANPAISTSDLYNGWYRYSNAEYGFSFSFPTDWILIERQNYVCLVHEAEPTLTFLVRFKYLSDDFSIQRTGVAAGDLVTQGTVNFLGQEVSRDVLVFEGKEKAVLYNYATEITVDDLVFTLSLDDFRQNYSSVDISEEIQVEVDKIVESFVLVPTSDCVHIERIPPESSEGRAIGKYLLATHHDLSKLQNPQFREIRSIDHMGDFVLFQAIVEGFEPAIFVLQKTDGGYKHIGSWGGQASGASEIRSTLAAEFSQIPLELLACLEPVWFY